MSGPDKKRDPSQSIYLPKETMLDGKYRIIQPLAEGGMGVVYRAEHVLMRKIVAIKRLHRDLMNMEQVAQRFEREAQAAAKIDHQNVCAVTDCGRDVTGAFFIVMELLEGESLQDIVDRDGSVEMGRLLNIAAQICSGLEKAHSMGVIHRDLKPENIMLIRKDDKKDVVKIMDFGIAKMITDDTPATSLTQAGMIFGTPHFLSPEQAAGDEIDCRSDLYSLGVIIFYMASGKYVFDDATVGALLRKHIAAPPPLLRDVAPLAMFPDGLQPILSRLLAKNPEDRYESAKQLRYHLIVILETFRLYEETSLAFESSVQVNVLDDENSSISRPVDIPLPIERDPTGIPIAVDRSKTGIPAAVEQFQVEVPPYVDRPYQAIPMTDSPVYDKISSKWRGNKKLRILTITLFLISAAALLVVILFFTKIFQQGGDEVYEEVTPERIQAALEQKRALFNELPEITRALSLTVEKKDDEALKSLASLESDPAFNKNSHYHYHVANIRVRTGNFVEGMESLEKCLEMEPDYAYDPMIIELLVSGLKHKDADVIASSLLVNHVTIVMKDTLEKIAREDESDDVRRAVITAMSRKNLIEKLKPWKQHAIDLANPDSTCASKKESFSKLEPVNDKELIPTLELIMRGKRCENQKCTLCIGEGLMQKIETLSGK